jgi:DNA-binding NtrC family response regulator
VPGILRVFGGDVALALPLPLSPRGEPLELGRGSPALGPTPDARMSRRHARVHVEGHRVWVTDLGSHNGTSVDGTPLPPGAPREVRDVVRMGDSLFVPCADLSPHQQRGVVVHEGFVRGPAMQALLDEATRAAELGLSMHLRGESGTGKEGLARAFHEGGGAARTPFVAVNCAAVPQNLAEALLFGARRGAYSGATDAEGYVAAADGGTLFLDEVAELDLVVQAKLLRVLETREVLALGATRPKAVRFRLCSASHRDLRDEVTGGRMREDLYFRLGRPELTLPPLRRRPEEVAFLLENEVRKVAPGLGVHVSLVEACLLRPWPGNIRELLVEARAAAQTALLRGAPRVEARHLSPLAGHAFRVGEPDQPSPALRPPSPPPRAIAASSPAIAPSTTPAMTSAAPSMPTALATPALPYPAQARPETDDAAPTPTAASPRETRNAPSTTPPASSPVSPEETPERRASRAKPLAPAERARIDAVLREVGGNVRAAARLLDVHRTHLRRLIDRGQVSRPEPDPTDETGEHDEPDP